MMRFRQFAGPVKFARMATFMQYTPQATNYNWNNNEDKQQDS